MGETQQNQITQSKIRLWQLCGDRWEIQAIWGTTKWTWVQ